MFFIFIFLFFVFNWIELNFFYYARAIYFFDSHSNMQKYESFPWESYREERKKCETRAEKGRCILYASFQT